MNMIKNLLAPFEIVNYVREDGNEAIYKIFRPSKHLFVNVKKDDGAVVGFKAWKLKNSGTNQDAGWRSFRFERIKSQTLAFV
jgi:hypothetical protein